MSFPPLRSDYFALQIVAAVNGPAIGIGVTLLPHCDVVYASSTATFWAPFSRIAVVPEFCSSLLFPQIMVSVRDGVLFPETGERGGAAQGFSRANEMLMMAKQLSAEEALSAGLISRILPSSELLPFVSEVWCFGEGFARHYECFVCRCTNRWNPRCSIPWLQSHCKFTSHS
jgi:enoyl-CoA hydratase/carnithine racemase